MAKTEEEDEEALSTPGEGESDDEWERVPSPSAKGADDDEWEKVETPPAETQPSITEKDLPGMTQKGLATANLRKLPFTPPTRFEKERPGDMGGEIAQGLGTLGRQAKGIAQSLVAPEMKGYQAYKQARESGQGKGAALGYGVARGVLAAAPGDPYGQAEEILHTPEEYAKRRAGGQGQEGNVEGYNPVYSALAPTAAQATQVDLPTMEAAARTGNVAGVRAEMGLPIAEAIGGPLAHEIGQIPAIKNAPGKVLNALHNPMTLGLTPEQLITKGVRPRQRATGWDAAINNPDVQRAIVDYHQSDPIRSLDDMKDAVPEIKEKIWDEKVQPALDRQGPRPMDKEMKAVAQDVRDAITPTMREFNPGGVAQLEKLAAQLERSRTVAEASELQKYANAQLQSYFDKYPTARRSALASHPDVLGWEVARRSLRENLIKVMEGAGETEAAPARKAYGDLTTIEKELERRKNPNDRSANTSLSRLLGWISAIPTLGVGAAVGELAHHLNKPDVNIRRGIAGLNPPEAAPFTPPAAYVPPPTPPAPPPPGAGLGGPFQIEQPPGGGPANALWQTQVGQPPPLESGAPRSPFQEPIGPPPGPPEPITPPIQGQQQRLPMPETPQEAPLFNLEPINSPRNVPELQRLPGAAGPPAGMEAEPGQVPAKVGEIAGKGEIQTTPAEQLKVGDTFVDDKGEPRRVEEIGADGKIKTADGTLRDYEKGEIEHQGELNSPQAQLARGGMFHPGSEEAEGLPPREGTEIQGEKPEILKGEEDKDKFVPISADEPDIVTAKEGSPSSTDIEKGTWFLNDDGSWIGSPNRETSPYPKHEHVADFIDEKKNPIRVGDSNAFDLTGTFGGGNPPTEAQISEMARIFKQSGQDKIFWELPGNGGEGSFADFRRAIERGKPGEIQEGPPKPAGRTGLLAKLRGGGEIEGPKAEIEAPEKKPPAREIPGDADKEKFLADQPDRAQAEERWDEMSEEERTAALEEMHGQEPVAAKRTSEKLSPEAAVDALKKRIEEVNSGKTRTSDWFSGKAPRNLKILEPGKMTPEMAGDTAFILDDGSAIVGDEGVRSHMQLAHEVGQDLLNDAHAVRVASADSFEVHGMPSEGQLAEMNRLYREAAPKDRATVHGHDAYWDFYPEIQPGEMRGYSADALHLGHETDSGSFSDFRRAMDDYYKPSMVSDFTTTPAGTAEFDHPVTEEELNEGRTDRFAPDAVHVSTRVPSSVDAEDAHTKPMSINMDAIQDKDLPQRLLDVVKKYPGMKEVLKDVNMKDPSAALAKFVEHISNNLEWLYNQMPKEIREITRGWYDSAHEMAKDNAKKFGHTVMQAAGVLATQSPQKDWFMNKSLADRIHDIYKNQQDTVFTPEMRAKGKQLTLTETKNAVKRTIKNLMKEYADDLTDDVTEKANNLAKKGQREAAFQVIRDATGLDRTELPTTKSRIGPALKKIDGKKLGELDQAGKAAWIRVFDEAHNPREFHEFAPDGTDLGIVKSEKTGKNKKVAWGGLNSIQKAVSILEDGSRENISKQLGAEHKVRNFYNNIVDPLGDRPDVTIDTHAVAAAHISPFSGKSHEVAMNFGGPKSDITGSSGTYALNAEGYRQAADRLGIRPRELQSIVWEQVRDLFPAKWKTAANMNAVKKIWGEYGKGNISLDEARDQIVAKAGGFKTPEWMAKLKAAKK